MWTVHLCVCVVVFLAVPQASVGRGNLLGCVWYTGGLTLCVCAYVHICICVHRGVYALEKGLYVCSLESAWQ